jgi:hypothetical protein
LAASALTNPSEIDPCKGIDQRKEPRRPAHGTVHLFREDPQKHAGEAPGSRSHGPVRSEIVGRLIDTSASGFRAAHGCATMTSGEIVGYSYAQTTGRARVVWTRVMAGASPTVESGFVILTEA